MTFTDDDLKRLKEMDWSITTPREVAEKLFWVKDQMPGLLARLEAAEVVCNLFAHGDKHTTSHWIALLEPTIENWRKAAGKAAE